MDNKKKRKTGLIFKKDFVAPEQANIYRAYMNKFSDPALDSFSPVSVALTSRKDIKEPTAMAEWVNSYKEAARELAIINQKRSNGYIVGTKPILRPVYGFYYTLPIIFLARHAAELAIKEATQKAGGKVNTNEHNLINLWNSFVNNFPDNKIPVDKNIAKKILSFLKLLSHLDDDGTKVRYAVDQMGNQTHEEFEWVNGIALADKVASLVDVLRFIDYEYVKDVKKTEKER